MGVKRVLRVRRAVTPTGSYVDCFRGFDRTYIYVSVSENDRIPPRMNELSPTVKNADEMNRGAGIGRAM